MDCNGLSRAARIASALFVLREGQKPEKRQR
jgi:hypothetical protein